MTKESVVFWRAHFDVLGNNRVVPCYHLNLVTDIFDELKDLCSCICHGGGQRGKNFFWRN